MDEMVIDTTDLTLIGEQARLASRQLARADGGQVDRALSLIADALTNPASGRDEILAANVIDVERAGADGLGDHIVDRLIVDEPRLRGIADDVRSVAALTSPVGMETESRVLANGVRLSRRRVPLGVIGVIYESRPNVTVKAQTIPTSTPTSSFTKKELFP